MTMLPLLLVVDDLFGRTDPTGRNSDRARLCGQLLLKDVSEDAYAADVSRIKQPIAEVVFLRGQRPARSVVGDVVENDLQGTVDFVRTRWKAAARPWSLALLDLCFYTGPVTDKSDSGSPGMPEGRPRDDDPEHYFGLELLSSLHSELPELPIVILSSKPREDVSERFARSGALGFLDRNAANPAMALRETIQQYALIQDDGEEIIGLSSRLLLTLRRARQLARNGENMLIRGETGTGKELLASYIRRNTPVGGKTSRPFVTVNAGAQNETMYYSELFGHRKGSFTGADSDREGAIVEADGGDVFLDEIADMPTSVQRGILRVLESGDVVPYGAKERDRREVSVRFLSATHGNLEEMVAAGEFREDLYQRLRQGGIVFLPPLRDRREDIPSLVEFFVRAAESQVAGARPRRVSDDAMQLIQNHEWPRNVRQLKECIIDAVSRYPDLEHLLPEHLDLPIHDRPTASSMPRQLAAAQVHSKTNAGNTIESILEDVDSFSFEALSDQQLAGRLQRLEVGFARFLVRYLREGLRRHHRPGGRVFIQPTLEYLAGGALSAASAYDVIKRLFRRGGPELEALLEDPLLRDAYEKSRRGRPTRRQKAKGGDVH